MKKLFMIGLAATAMLASCSNDETMEMAQQKAIGFSNAFVNNGTRSIVDPSFTKETLEDFAVYGFTQNGQIFEGDKVYEGGSASTGWSYDVQYLTNNKKNLHLPNTNIFSFHEALISSFFLPNTIYIASFQP